MLSRKKPVTETVEVAFDDSEVTFQMIDVFGRITFLDLLSWNRWNNILEWHLQPLQATIFQWRVLNNLVLNFSCSGRQAEERPWEQGSFNLIDGLFTVKNKIILHIHIDQHELATRFYTFFDSNISDLLDNLTSSSDISNCHCYDKKPTPSSYELSTFRPVTYENVKSVIMSSRTKSCSLDPMPTVLVKRYIDILVHHHRNYQLITYHWRIPFTI